LNRRDRKREETRSKLLAAAMTEFAKHGLYATRIEDITESADIAKGTFYNYFNSRQDLVAQLLTKGVELLEQEYFNRIAVESPVESRLRALVEQQEAFWRDHPGFALLFHQARGWLLLEPEAPALKRTFQKYLECISRLLYPPTGPTEPAAHRSIQEAAALAGMIAGYRSFAFAAGLEMDLCFAKHIAAASISNFYNIAGRDEYPLPGAMQA